MIIPCLILGDSIADGTGAALRLAIGDRCAVIAKVGASSSAILHRAPAGSFASAVISAGSNDPNNFNLASNLMALRRSVSAAKVVWIMPYNRRAAAAVSSVAVRFGDRVIDLAWCATRDGLHPRSYGWIARSVADAGYAGTTLRRRPT